MTQQQLEVYRAMYKALNWALDEIHNPGFNRICGLNIVEYLELVRKRAELAAPEEW